MKSVFEKDFWQLDNLRQTWEYKTFAFLIRGVVAVIVVFYLLFALPSIYPWAEREWARLQPREHFEVLLNNAQKTGDYKYALKWLNYRRTEDSDYFISVIEDKSSDLPALFFGYNARHFAQRQDDDNMLFWMMFSRYRLRYDILRCGNPEMIEKVNMVFALLSKLQNMDNDKFEQLQQDKSKLKKSIEQVLAFDAKRPARNHPRTTCETFAHLNDLKTMPVPQEEWADVRHTLRIVTESSLRRMDAPAP